MTGHKRESVRQDADERRYAALEHLLTPDGDPVVRKEYDYITIWGFWNGPDELLAAADGQYYYAVNAQRAFANKTISQEVLKELMRLKAERLARLGFEDLNPKPDHLLVSLDAAEKIVVGTLGKPEVRLCNFELIRRRPSPAAGECEFADPPKARPSAVSNCGIDAREPG